MRIVVPKERDELEFRVAAVPDSVKKLIKLGFQVSIEAGAGSAASFTDDAYREAGADVVAEQQELYAQADIILKVLALTADEIELVKPGTTVVSFVWPAQNEDFLKSCKEKNIIV